MPIHKLVIARAEIDEFLNRKRQRQHFDQCSNHLVLLFVSMAYNAAKGNLDLSEEERAILKPYRKLFLKLGYLGDSVAEKRELLNSNCKLSLEAIKALAKITFRKIEKGILQ